MLQVTAFKLSSNIIFKSSTNEIETQVPKMFIPGIINVTCVLVSVPLTEVLFFNFNV